MVGGTCTVTANPDSIFVLADVGQTKKKIERERERERENCGPEISEDAKKRGCNAHL